MHGQIFVEMVVDGIRKILYILDLPPSLRIITKPLLIQAKYQFITKLSYQLLYELSDFRMNLLTSGAMMMSLNIQTPATITASPIG